MGKNSNASRIKQRAREISDYTDSVYGNDPQGNDSGILSL